MDNKIRHDGVIESVEDRLVRVRIMQDTACAACRVASHCHTAGAKEKIVDVLTGDDTSQWHVGQAVVVSTYAKTTALAALLVFGVPVVLVFAVLAAALASGCSEGQTSLMIIGALCLHFLILWFFRSAIAQKIAFQIEEARE